jgi:hypothetical protein
MSEVFGVPSDDYWIDDGTHIVNFPAESLPRLGDRDGVYITQAFIYRNTSSAPASSARSRRRGSIAVSESDTMIPSASAA